MDDDADADADDDGLKYCGVLTPLLLNQEGLIANISVWACAGKSLIGRKSKPNNIKKENISDSPTYKMNLL